MIKDSCFTIEYQANVVIIKLNRGIINAINLALIKELGQIVEKADKDDRVKSLVFSSANDKFFSIGFDIPELYELNRKEFTNFFHHVHISCYRLFTLHKPTIAAITGHATAGGCVIAMCCDYRYMAEGRKLMGLNEILLGVPVPYLADCILREVVGIRLARNVLEDGEFYPADTLFGMGMVDKILPLDQVLPSAIEKAEQMGSLASAAYWQLKQNRIEVVKRRIRANLRAREQHFINCWFSEPARTLLKKACEKFTR